MSHWECPKIESMKYIKLGLLVLLMSCKPSLENNKTQVNSDVISLNDRAFELASFKSDDSISLAIEVLDSAIKLQPDHFYSHYNKMFYQNELGRRSDAAITAQIVSELKPFNPLLLMVSGLLKEVIDDTTLTQQKYSNSKVIFKNMLDTIPQSSARYGMFQFFYGVNLKLLYCDQASDSVFKIISQDSSLGFEFQRQKAKKYIIMTRKEMILDYIEND